MEIRRREKEAERESSFAHLLNLDLSLPAVSVAAAEVLWAGLWTNKVCERHHKGGPAWSRFSRRPSGQASGQAEEISNIHRGEQRQPLARSSPMNDGHLLVFDEG